MQVGDTMLVPDSDIKRVTSNTQKARMATGFKYKCRATSHGVRVWRVT